MEGNEWGREEGVCERGGKGKDVCRCGWMEAGRMEGGQRWSEDDRGANN